MRVFSAKFTFCGSAKFSLYGSVKFSPSKAYHYSSNTCTCTCVLLVLFPTTPRVKLSWFLWYVCTCVIILCVSVLRAKSSWRFGGIGSHVHVLSPWQPSLAGAEGRHTQGEVPEDWGHKEIYTHRGALWKLPRYMFVLIAFARSLAHSLSLSISLYLSLTPCLPSLQYTCMYTHHMTNTHVHMYTARNISNMK